MIFRFIFLTILKMDRIILTIFNKTTDLTKNLTKSTTLNNTLETTLRIIIFFTIIIIPLLTLWGICYSVNINLYAGTFNFTNGCKLEDPSCEIKLNCYDAISCFVVALLSYILSSIILIFIIIIGKYCEIKICQIWVELGEREELLKEIV